MESGIQKSGEGFFENFWLDGGVTDQRGLNSREEVAKAMGVYQTAGDHGCRVGEVARVASLNFCEDLGVGVVVVEVELPVAREKGAALLPAGKFGECFEIDVYGGLAPTMKNRRGSTDEINTPRAAHLLAKRGAK